MLISIVYFAAYINVFVDHYGYWSLINALLTAGLIFWQVYTMIKLIKLDSSAYMTNVILMVGSAVHCSVTFLLAEIYTNSYFGLVLCGLFYFLLFVLPNYIYFKNRKSLFYDNGTEQSPSIHIVEKSKPLVIIGIILLVLQLLIVFGNGFGNNPLKNINWDEISSPSIYTIAYLFGFFLVGLTGLFLFIIGTGNEKQANNITIGGKGKKGEKSELTEEENTSISDFSNEGDKDQNIIKSLLQKWLFISVYPLPHYASAYISYPIHLK